MILVVVDKTSARLDYVCKIIFDIIQQTDHSVITNDEIQNYILRNPAASIIYYSDKNTFGEGANVIYNSGLLNESDISDKSKHLKFSDNLLKYGSQSGDTFLFDFDIFSTVFYFVTQYHYYTDKEKDEHNRFKDANNPLIINQLHQKPYLHQLAEMMWDKLLDVNQLLYRKNRTPSYKVTIDVDYPYYVKGREPLEVIKSYTKDVLTFNMEAIKAKNKYFFNKTDIYDTYHEIESAVPKENLIYFFLIDSLCSHDGKHTYKDKEYQKLIKDKYEKKIEVGIHPSYNSHIKQTQIIQQKLKLEEIVLSPIYSTRMHFLQYDPSTTYPYMVDIGIKHDYTLCFKTGIGFPTGMAVGYPYFDLAKNSETSLTLHPTMAMDRSLESYMKLSPQEAVSQLKTLVDTTYQFGGEFILLWHNSSLSNSFEWKGWKNVFTETVEYLKSK